MKKLLFFLLLGCTIILQAQTVSNTGNRNQTYPNITQVNPAVQAMVNQVSTSNIEASIRYMQNLGIRIADSEIALHTQNWLVEQFESYGLETMVQHFPCKNWNPYHKPALDCTKDTLDAGNVIAIQRGTEFPNEYIVVSSHYDHQSGPKRQ